jgi:hypothetical protein
VGDIVIAVGWAPAAAAGQREGALEAVSVLPCQFGDRLSRMVRIHPEMRLQLAVLEDAILTFHRLLGVEGTRPRRLFAEVEDWFSSDEADDPFTFVTICDTLDLDPDYLRGGLRRWCAVVNVAAKRTAPFRRAGIGKRHLVVSRRVRRVA